MKTDGNNRTSFVMYESFEMQKLPDNLRLRYYDSLIAYGLRQEAPDLSDSWELESIWKLVTPQIDANYKKFLNGSKGGAPRGNQNASKGEKQPKNNQKTTENNPMSNEKCVMSNENEIRGTGDDTPVPLHNEKFKKPTVDEVRKYCEEKHINIDPGRFIDYYESNGWKVGKSTMKNWRAAIRNWNRNQQPLANDIQQRREAQSVPTEELA